MNELIKNQNETLIDQLIQQTNENISINSENKQIKKQKQTNIGIGDDEIIPPDDYQLIDGKLVDTSYYYNITSNQPQNEQQQQQQQIQMKSDDKKDESKPRDLFSTDESDYFIKQFQEFAEQQKLLYQQQEGKELDMKYQQQFIQDQQQQQQQQINQEVENPDNLSDVQEDETNDSEINQQQIIQEVSREFIKENTDGCKEYRIKYNNGDIYEGEVNEETQLKEGFGIYYYNNSEKYEGFFQDDLIHGYGQYWFLGGHHYEGDWSEGKKQGPGILQFSNGDKYQGLLRNDTYHGEGEIFYANGDKFEGIFKSGKKHGPGKFFGKGKQGRRMIGNWVEDEFSNDMNI